MSAVILRGDARKLPLPDASVDLVVTSPPYWSLRSYTDGGEHYDGQIGDEVTPAEYIANLLDCTREWTRVLKPSGSIFVVLGDKYSDRADGGPSSARSGRGDHAEVLPPGRSSTAFAPRKSRLMLPERYRIGCVDELGLIARAVIIWAKPSGLPESVTDRVRVSHEDVVHLVKEPRYYSAVDEIREQGTGHGSLTWEQRKALGEPMRQGEQRRTFSDGLAPNPLGKLPGSVWEVATQPLKVPAELGVDHFAAFPSALVRRIILGWSPSGICTVCGEGRRPMVDARVVPVAGGSTSGGILKHPALHKSDGRVGVAKRTEGSITGYACACPEPSAPTRPSVIVDPFGGTGTTSLVADVLGRHGVSVDRSADYCRLARWRTTDPGERARALGVSKPPPVPVGQLDMFAEESA